MKILGIGTTVVDRVVVIDEYPAQDTKSEIRRSWVQVGGPVPVALSTSAAFGVETRLLSRWADDPDGLFIQTTLASRKIDLQFVCSHPDWQSGSAQVWLSEKDGTRTIAFSRGTFPPLAADDVSDELLEGCSILHLDGWASQAAIPAAIKMKEKGGAVVLDAGSVKPGLHELLPHVDVLIASKLFRNAFRQCSASPCSQTSDQRNLPSEFGVPTVVTTNGQEGATLYGEDKTHHVQGHKVAVVDSNGAGDIFSGAVLYGMAQGWSMIKVVEFANKTAAESCTRFGNAVS